MSQSPKTVLVRICLTDSSSARLTTCGLFLTAFSWLIALVLAERIGNLCIAHRHLVSPRFLTDIVPQTDDGFVAAVVFKAKYADAGGAAEEKPPGAGRQPEP